MNKTGVSCNGHIENTNKVKAVECNCSTCHWSKITHYGDVYCNYYKKNNPEIKKCKRYSEKLWDPIEDKGKKKVRKIS